MEGAVCLGGNYDDYGGRWGDRRRDYEGLSRKSRFVWVT